MPSAWTGDGGLGIRKGGPKRAAWPGMGRNPQRSGARRDIEAAFTDASGRCLLERLFGEERARARLTRCTKFDTMG